MAGQLEIINKALSCIGANSITSLTEGTAEQTLAVLNYDMSRQACLREYPWNFSLTDVELSQLADYPGFEFKYAYPLPTDCLRVVNVYDDRTYKVQGKLLLTDSTTCKIKYVGDVQDPTVFDPLFADALAHRLASDMGYALTKSQATADSAFAIYQRKMAMARHVDSTEDVSDPLGGHYSAYIAVRG